MFTRVDDEKSYKTCSESTRCFQNIFVFNFLGFLTRTAGDYSLSTISATVLCHVVHMAHMFDSTTSEVPLVFEWVLPPKGADW